MTSLPAVPPGRIIRAADAQRWLDGYAVIEQARAEAAAIRATMQAEVANARLQGYEDGVRDGAAEAQRLVEEARLQAARYTAGVEEGLVELVFAMVRRILGGFDDRQLVASVLRPALAAFRDERQLSITVAPAMVPHVEALLSDMDQAGQAITVVGDRHLARDQCLVAGPRTSIDATVESQLAVMRDTMVAPIADPQR